MPVNLQQNGESVLLLLEGVVSAEETDEVVGYLKGTPGIRLDLSACEHLHTAVLQAIVVLRPDIAALPADPFWQWCFPGSDEPNNLQAQEQIQGEREHEDDFTG